MVSQRTGVGDSCTSMRACSAKKSNVGIEEIGAEPEDDHSGFCQLNRHGIFDTPVIGRIANRDASLGTVTATYMLEERENDSKNDALLDAKDDDGGRSDKCDGEFVGLGALNFSQAAMVDEFDAYMEHDGGEDSVGEKAERPGEKKKNRENHSGSCEVGPSTPAVCGVYHGGLRGTAIDDESTAAPCGCVGKGR